MATVRTEEREGCLWITFERPPLNVLDIPMIKGLGAALHSLPERHDLKAVVLRSAVDGTFSAGVDVRDHARDRVGEMLDAFHAVFRLLDVLPQATVAAVDGRCLGGACELAAFSDVLLATPRSTFGQPEIDVGCFPPVAAALLPRLIGRRAFEMVLLGESLPAAEAERIGLVSRVVEDVEAATQDLVRRLTAKSGAVLSLARRAVRQGGHDSFPEALAHMERIYVEDLLRTADCAEGVAAFLEKRRPLWRDR
jgi:cyclohexa-1,5-dienecarbonyl-CoA hydratase